MLQTKPDLAQRTFSKWVLSCEALQRHYAVARAMRGDIMFDDALRVADSPLRPAIEHPLAYSAEVQRKRLQVDTRKWAAGRLNPAYRDGPSAAHPTQDLVTHTKADLLEEIMRRLERKASHLASQEAQRLSPPGNKGFPFSGDRGVGVVEAETGGGRDNPSLPLASRAQRPDPLTSPSRTRSAPEPEILPPVKSGSRELPPDLAVNPFLGRVVPFDETEIEE